MKLWMTFNAPLHGSDYGGEVTTALVAADSVEQAVECLLDRLHREDDQEQGRMLYDQIRRRRTRGRLLDADWEEVAALDEIDATQPFVVMHEEHHCGY